MKSVLIASAVVSSVWGNAIPHRFPRHTELEGYSFQDYVRHAGKKYSREEYGKRESIFEENMKKIRLHNLGKASWKMGVNQFTDMSKDEMRTYFGADKRALHLSTKQPQSMLRHNVNASLPSSVDWRDQNVISPVKDQGHCGSCWAFASTATIESYAAINTGIMNEVSMQELVSCMPNDDSCGGVGGCGGATAELAFDYLAENGLPEEWAYGYYPSTYKSGKNGDCLFGTLTEPARFVTGTGYVLLPRNDYNELLNAVANIGPMAVNVDASEWSSYESGVFTGCPQTDVDINHVVQLVGYGTDPEYGDYWTIRNSWSALYGESGYIRIARSEGYCGLDYHNGDGVGCSYDPTTVEVCGMCGVLYDSSYPTGVAYL